MRASPALLLALVATSALAFALAGTPAEADLITDLPGLPADVTYKQYAGYVDVDPAHGRKLFYWLQMSQRDPETDPLVLWLNGGPGCSSIGGGLMSEMGAFRPNGEELETNPWSWNRIANMVYLESPAGVGFSFSDDPADYTVGDNRTAHDSYTFLLGFFQRFPQFQNTPFWVTGESYGGHYVPGLSALIVQENEKVKAAGGTPINFKGMMVGNAWTDANYDNHGAAYDWLTHNLISEDTYTGLLNNCNFSNIGPLAMEMKATADMDTINPTACNNYQMQATQEMGNIDIYNIYVDMCEPGLPTVPSSIGITTHATDDDPSSDNANGGRIEYNPCVGNDIGTYLNRLDVQMAIHANTTLGYRWSGCSPRVDYSRFDLLSSMLPTYKFLLQSDIEILVYSGDVDAIVPTPGTRAWLAELDLNVSTPWRPWNLNNQVAGYVTQYEGLRFTTIRNAGHMVPQFQPSRAFKMFDDFMNGKDF